MRDEDCKSSDPVSSTGMASTRRKDVMPLYVFHTLYSSSSLKDPSVPTTYHIEFFTQPTFTHIKHVLWETFEMWHWKHKWLRRLTDWVDDQWHKKVRRCHDDCGVWNRRDPDADDWEEFVGCTHYPATLRMELHSYHLSELGKVKAFTMPLTKDQYDTISAAGKHQYEN